MIEIATSFPEGVFSRKRAGDHANRITPSHSASMIPFFNGSGLFV
jgi:hypothetical protein